MTMHATSTKADRTQPSRNSRRAIAVRWLLSALLLIVALLILASPARAVAAPAADDPQLFQITLNAPGDQGGMSSAVKILLMLSLLAFAPAIMICLTSFTRIIVVLAFARQAIGTQQTPPNQVLIGIALFLTMFTMAPTFGKIHQVALGPYLEESIDESQAFEQGLDVLKTFMLRHTRLDDLELFYQISNEVRPASPDEIPMRILAPSFIISELKTAFMMGFCIFIPFLLLDMLVSAVLMAMGMMMLPPVLISLPFKILLFVLVDGWHLLVGSIASGYL